MHNSYLDTTELENFTLLISVNNKKNIHGEKTEFLTPDSCHSM